MTRRVAFIDAHLSAGGRELMKAGGGWTGLRDDNRDDVEQIKRRFGR